MMNKILIVEDDSNQSTNLKKILYELDRNIKIYEAQSKEDALEISNKTEIDIFYVDIHLKNSSGIDFAKELRKIEKYKFSWVIFITTHIQYIIECLKEVHCYDYIIKPYEKKDIMQLTQKLIFEKQNNAIALNERKYIVFDMKNGINIRIYIDEIILIETNFRSCYIHTKRGKYETKELGLKKCLDLIDCNDLIQSYKSCIVNVKYIEKIHSIDSKVSEIFFEDYTVTAPLGYKYKKSVIEKFKLY